MMDMYMVDMDMMDVDMMDVDMVDKDMVNMDMMEEDNKRDKTATTTIFGTFTKDHLADLPRLLGLV